MVLYTCSKRSDVMPCVLKSVSKFLLPENRAFKNLALQKLTCVTRYARDFLSSQNLNHEVAAKRIIDPQFLKILDTL